ncbi:Transient receptor potential cation channel subfamily M member 8 [Taenia solium]|eukprot:TsM_000711500 transcript=TsM_000711500 gene=TsM_000711500
MSIESFGSWGLKRERRSRQFSQHLKPSIIPSLPLLGQVIGEDGDATNLDLDEEAFSGFRTDLRDNEVLRLIETIRKDDAKQFSSFTFRRIESLTMNVTLTDLPSVEYMARSFWNALNNIGLLHTACILSAHAIIDVLLRRNVTFSMTDESVTPVHICAAMGDYVGLRKLLAAGLPYLTQDRLGRIPLHYAVQTNLPTVIMFLAKDMSLLNVADFENKLPLTFCQHQQPQIIEEYIIEVTNALNGPQLTDDANSEVEADENQEMVSRGAHCTLPLHFEAYLCTRVRPMHSLNRRTFCECSDDVARHEKFSESEILNELIASRNEVFVKQPTNTFGQFETPCSNLVAEFLRIADDTPVDKLAELFFGIWKLRKPDLALTLYGSVPQQKSFQKRFDNMIFSVFQKTLTWVITDGIYDSIAETMSHGMRGYVEAYGLTKLQAIGIVPWRRLSFQADLHSADFSGTFQARFPDHERASAIQTQIAPFHTRYLFVDSGARNDFYCIQDFRTKLEFWLSKIRLEEETFELSHNIPLCGLLVAGRPEDALGVYQALCRSIPFVVVADSGGLASILERCVLEMEYLQGGGSPYADDTLGDTELDETESTERILEIMCQYWAEEEIQQESLDMVLKIMAYSQLIEFFSSDKSPERTLDESILSALINPALFQTQESQHTWKPRLKIALELDRSGFVLEKILDGAKWTPKELAPFVKSCLLKNKVDFLRMFADVGFEIHEFATTKTVEELYSVEAQRNLPAQITIGRVRNTLQKLMGHNLLTYDKENPKRPGTIRGTLRADAYNAKRKKDHCIQYLYLWALATRRFEIAHLLLTMLTDISAGALFAAAFLRRISKKTRSPSDSTEQSRYARFVLFVFSYTTRDFEQLAVSILDACYFNNKENTMLLLVMERRSFAMLSCMMIASEGNCREFMQHRACQEYVDRVWAYTLLIKKTSGRFILSLVVGAVFPPAVPFVAEYDEAMYYKSAKSLEVVTYIILFFILVVNIEIELDYSNLVMFCLSTFLILVALAHFIEFVRIILRLLSIGEYVGPKLQMIKKMASISLITKNTITMDFKIETTVPDVKYRLSIEVKEDLLPYSLILCMFWILYSLIFSAVIIRPYTIYNPFDAVLSLFHVLQSSFFQMFGEFQAEDFIDHYGYQECTNVTSPGCTYPGYGLFIPLLMAIFTLTTHVLLINLLIAIFTMEAMSQQLWTMQRYRLVEYILTESVQPGPFLIFSLAYRLAALDNPGRERQLINWEKLCALVMMGMHEEDHELKKASKGESALENMRKGMKNWRTPTDRSWQIVRRILPPTWALQNLAKSGPVTDDLGKRIDEIAAKLEKISDIISGRPLESKVLSPSTTKPSPVPSREGSRRSSINSTDIMDVPIMAQWHNHQIAVYSSLTSDTTPHALDPPIPWEMLYPKYHAIPWSPRRFMVPQWQTNNTPTPGASRLHSLDSTALSFHDPLPKNPEGRVGTAGKGLLPKYGANPACIVVVARGSSNDEVLILKGIRPQAQFPWILALKDSTASWVRTDNLPSLRRSHLAALMAIIQ